MIVKPVDNMIQLVRFLANPENTAALVDDGDVYALKPDALYVGIYDGAVLAGVHEVRQFWQNVVECHCIYASPIAGASHCMAINFSAAGCWKTTRSRTA